MNIQQTDKNRCLAWTRLSLKEGTISSFMTLLSNDNQVLRYIIKSLLKDYFTSIFYWFYFV